MFQLYPDFVIPSLCVQREDGLEHVPVTNEVRLYCTDKMVCKGILFPLGAYENSSWA